MRSTRLFSFITLVVLSLGFAGVAQAQEEKTDYVPRISAGVSFQKGNLDTTYGGSWEFVPQQSKSTRAMFEGRVNLPIMERLGITFGGRTTFRGRLEDLAFTNSTGVNVDKNYDELRGQDGMWEATAGVNYRLGVGCEDGDDCLGTLLAEISGGYRRINISQNIVDGSLTEERSQVFKGPMFVAGIGLYSKYVDAEARMGFSPKAMMDQVRTTQQVYGTINFEPVIDTTPASIRDIRASITAYIIPFTENRLGVGVSYESRTINGSRLRGVSQTQMVMVPERISSSYFTITITGRF